MPHADLALTRRVLVAQASALALLGSTASVDATTHGDAELLRLGTLMDAAWAAENRAFAEKDALDDLVNAYAKRTMAIVDQIEAIPATTLAGLIVRARACAWCQGGEPFDEDTFAFNGSATTDVRLASAVLRDLIAIGGTPLPVR